MLQKSARMGTFLTKPLHRMSGFLQQNPDYCNKQHFCNNVVDTDDYGFLQWEALYSMAAWNPGRRKAAAPAYADNDGDENDRET